MTPIQMRALPVALFALALGACRTTPRSAMQSTPQPAATTPPAGMVLLSGVEKARADSMRLPYTAADVRFMTSMIAHHSQAITISRWAPTHGASPSVLRLAERIINAQQDEIGTMQTWLRDRRQPVPEAGAPMSMSMSMPMHGTDSTKHEMSGHDMAGHDMAGHDMAGHDMSTMPAMMPGMLSPEQLAQLDAARGPEFDRLFLTFMIQHHRGATSMVQQLFGTYGAGQDELVFKFASDVNVDQTTEIARMQRMLVALALGATEP